MPDPIRPAIIGKHPDFGDFIRHGLPPDVAEKLMRWIDTTLARVKSAAGDDWEAFWDSAQATRFWLGRDVLGATALGVMLPSHDRVGRRYPLLLLALGVEAAPPFQDPADAVMQRIESHLNHARGGGPGGVGALLEGLDLSDLPAEGAAPERLIWAHHPGGDLDALLAQAARVDHALVSTSRSYWWAPARGWRAATWLGCDGLPGHEALSWLLAGEAGDPAPEGPAPQDPPPARELPEIAPPGKVTAAAPERAAEPRAWPVPDTDADTKAPDLTRGDTP